MTYPSDQNDPQSSGYPGYPAGGGYPGNYPGGYPASTPAGGGRLRGRRPIQIGGILMIVGLVLVVIGGVIGNTSAYSKVDGFQRVAVKDGTGTITFKNAGGYVAYYESDEVTNSTSQKIPEIPVQLTDQATGQKMVLQTPYGNRSDGKIKYLHYDHNGHKGLAMWQFHIDQPGTYQVELTNNTAAAPDATVAFGKSIASGVVVGGVFVIIGVLLLLAGLIVLIVGLVKRRRHKRELREGYGYGGPSSFGGYGGAQPAGWPQAPQAPQAPQSPPGQAWPSQPSQTWPPPDAGPQPGSGPEQPGWPPAPEPPKS
ncbi:MAG TPA: hypothetical protein VH373_15665 [Jatrophihabitantaceae bacterium]